MEKETEKWSFNCAVDDAVALTFAECMCDGQSDDFKTFFWLCCLDLIFFREYVCSCGETGVMLWRAFGRSTGDKCVCMW